jgi:hypothetical protein
MLAVRDFCQRALHHSPSRRVRVGFSLGLLAVVGWTLLASVAARQAQGALTVPAEWRGTWEVTVNYRDRATGALVATDVTTEAICPGEPIAPPLLNTLLHLSG